MSEGPQVLRRTQWLHKHLQGRRVLRCHSTRENISADDLSGRVIARAFCKGKHIFVEFDGGTFLHNHLLMRGTWRKLIGQQLFYPDATWLALYVGPFTICNLKGQMLKLVTEKLVKAQCESLGPDALAEPFPRDEIRQSLTATHLPASEALLAQTILCGVGNIAKSEALFLAGVNPHIAGCELLPAQMDRLLEAIRIVLRTSYDRGGSWTCRIYRRHGQRCDQCRTVIRSLALSPSKRTTYFCPKCQR
jgi:endonuclease-8